MFIIIVTVEVAISGSTGMFRHTHPLYKAHDGLPIPAFYPFSKNTSRSEALHLAAANGQEAVVKVRGKKLPGWGWDSMGE